MVARYKVLETMFCAPLTIFEGSEIEFTGTPGPHLAPLNEEAEAAFERWYAIEMEEFDEHRKKTGKLYNPYERFRPLTAAQRGEIAEQQMAVVVKEPPKDLPGQSLAELSLRLPTADPRPAGRGTPSAPEAGAESFDGGVKVAVAAAPKKGL